VPRHRLDPQGSPLRHFSWVELGDDGAVCLVAQRWYGVRGELVEDQMLLEQCQLRR